MSTLNALVIAVEVASRKRDEAQRMLQDAKASQQAAHDQLEQLQGYARETEARWGMKPDMAVQPEVMYHHYQFMDRLGHAVHLQTGVLADHAGRVEKAADALLSTQLRLASLRKVVERRQHDLMVLQTRQEQKQTDERAALLYRKVTNGP